MKTPFRHYLPGAAALVALAAAAAAWAAPPSDPLFDEIGQIVSELSRITGLKPLRRVDYARIGRDRVKQFLQDRVKEAVKPEEIRAEELTLKKFGFVPADFNLEKATIDLLTEQAAAFYDYRRKKLFVIDANSDFVQHSALVHELAHALADQHFNLKRFIDRASKNDDTSLARLAVMEGQATWLMAEYLTRRTGQSLKDAPALVQMWSQAGDAAGGQYPQFDRAPLYLRETMLFPYTYGMLFQNAVIKKMDQAGFSEVFRHPPATSQQILHPEKYFAGVRATRPPPPEPPDPHAYRTYTDGEMGELDHQVLLKQYAGEKEAAALAPAWRGGYYRLLERKDDKRMVLAYASEWDSPEAAHRFFSLYVLVLKGKWKHFEPGARTETTLDGQGDDGHFLLRCDGTRVTSLEGLKAAAAATPAAAVK